MNNCSRNVFQARFYALVLHLNAMLREQHGCREKGKHTMQFAAKAASREEYYVIMRLKLFMPATMDFIPLSLKITKFPRHLLSLLRGIPDLFLQRKRRPPRFDCDWSSDVCSSDLGDTIRTAADMRVPMVAVTLLHRKGYF